MGHDSVGFEVSIQQYLALDQPADHIPARNQVSLQFAELPTADRLADAVGRAVEHHEILRTTFLRPAGAAVPLQVVQTSLDVPIVEVAAPADGSSPGQDQAAEWAEELSTGAVRCYGSAWFARATGGR